MAITLVPMVCPQCGAQIDVPVEKDECFCMYCGTKILINNDNVKSININHHIVDEARIAEAEAEGDLKGWQIVLLVAIVFIGLIVLEVFASGSKNAM